MKRHPFCRIRSYAWIVTNNNDLTLFPDIGFIAKQFSYFEIEDIKYYEVPTPTTEISYKTGLQQGQFLDAIFTLNFSKRFNVGILYKGIRSLGNYRNSLASHGNFRAVFSYRNKSERYAIRGHIATQDLTNQENGGITQTSLDAFINAGCAGNSKNFDFLKSEQQWFGSKDLFQSR